MAHCCESPRRALHARIAEAIEGQFADIAESRPELLARITARLDQSERAASLWGKAGQRSLEHSALVEASEQLTRAADQMATLPATPALRREQIKLQVALITPLMQVKGHAAPETIAAAERAHLLISEAEARGETLEDPLLLFSVLYGFWVTAHAAFKGNVMRELATQFLTLAEKQGATVPLLVGHRLMGSSLTLTGDIQKGRAHYDQAVHSLRRCRTSLSDDEVRSRLGSSKSVFSVIGSLVTWVSVGRSKRFQRRNPLCAGDWSPGQLDTGAYL